MPNTLSVGDSRKIANPLSKDLEMFLHETQEMAILVSFGGLFEHLPAHLEGGFCNVFRQLKHQVIWKLKNATYCENVKNVKVMDWIPQNDILAHPKIRLFITHGGFNSLFLEDISLNLPLPNMPNTVSVGDFRRPAKLLSEDLESFLHETQEMAILVSFGSLFDYVPEYLARSFCNVFRQLKHQVIWKLKMPHTAKM